MENVFRMRLFSHPCTRSERKKRQRVSGPFAPSPSRGRKQSWLCLRAELTVSAGVGLNGGPQGGSLFLMKQRVRQPLWSGCPGSWPRRLVVPPSGSTVSLCCQEAASWYLPRRFPGGLLQVGRSSGPCVGHIPGYLAIFGLLSGLTFFLRSGRGWDFLFSLMGPSLNAG